MFKSDKSYSEFTLKGSIQNVWMKEGKPKYITVLSHSSLFWIKLSKEVRSVAEATLTPGADVEVRGRKKQDKKTGIIKLKADSVTSNHASLSSIPPLTQPAVTVKTVESSQKPAKILVCQKSDCRRRGSDGICSLLAKELEERGLQDQVTIQKTGCLKQCKAGPNVVMLPDKTRYSNVEPEEIPTLIDQHFNQKVAVGHSI